MGLLDQWGERSDRLSDDMSSYADGDINMAQMALRTAGETAGGLGDVAGTVMDPLIPEIVKEGIGAVVQGAVESPLGKIAMKWMEDHPEQARDLMSAANVASLLPGAAISKAGKKMLSYGDDARKGGTVATASNYITNQYAPDRAASVVEKGLGKVAAKVKGMDEKAATQGVMQTLATPIHIAKSVPDALRHLVSPKSRAQWGENGVSMAGQRHIAREFKKQGTEFAGFDGPQKYTRGPERAVAQTIYTQHIGKGSGRKGATHPLQQELFDRSTLTDYIPMNEKNMADTISQFTYKFDPDNAARTKDLTSGAAAWREMPEASVDPQVAAFAAKYIHQRITPNSKTSFVVKAPSSRMSGGHFNDVAKKNPANAELATVFGKYADADGNVDVGLLFKELEGRRGKANAKLKEAGRRRDSWSVVNKDLKHVQENGLWLTGSRGGSAVTEGGVSWLTKLDPDGTMTTFMIDKHDFLEKGPTGPIVKGLLPNDVVAISPPMVSNIKQLRTVKRPDRQVNKKKIKGEVLRANERHLQVQHPQGWGGTGVEHMDPEGLLGQYLNIKPSARNVRGEQLRNVGAAASLGGLLYADNQ